MRERETNRKRGERGERGERGRQHGKRAREGGRGGRIREEGNMSLRQGGWFVMPPVG